MDIIGREAIPQGKNAFVFTRLLHSVRNDIFYCVIASEAWQSHPEGCHCERSVAISSFILKF